MNEYRKNLVIQAYAKLDRDGNGFINIDDIKGKKYNNYIFYKEYITQVIILK